MLSKQEVKRRTECLEILKRELENSTARKKNADIANLRQQSAVLVVQVKSRHRTSKNWFGNMRCTGCRSRRSAAAMTRVMGGGGGEGKSMRGINE